MRVSGKKIAQFGMGVASVGLIFASFLPAMNASAAQITNRSLTLEAGVTDGGSLPNGVVNHYFQFTMPAVGSPSVGSIAFTYCTTASGTCTMPVGLVTTAATYSETGSGATGFTLVNTTNGSPYITRTAASVAPGTVGKFKLIGVTNPTAPNTSFFVRINTYASTDTTGTAIDSGTVTASTATAIVLTGIMPESIIFCTGQTVSTTAGIPDCSTATPGAVNFNQLFSPTDTAFATSQMAASTNASFGYSITVAGTTLTSGTNTIPAIGATAAASAHGVGQFGMNLMANTTPAVTNSADVNPTPNGTNFKGQPDANFNTTNTFAFDPTAINTIATSDNGGAGPTDSQIFTSSYIVNVSGSQTAGTYTTTLTYICTATF